MHTSAKIRGVSIKIIEFVKERYLIRNGQLGLSITLAVQSVQGQNCNYFNSTLPPPPPPSPSVKEETILWSSQQVSLLCFHSQLVPTRSVQVVTGLQLKLK